MSTETFVDQVRKKKEKCFQKAEKNPVNALALFYANLGYHTFGQHLQFRLPPATLAEVRDAALPDLEEATLTNDDCLKFVKEFSRCHSYFPTDLPACGACGQRSNLPDDTSMQYETVLLSNQHLMSMLLMTEPQLSALRTLQRDSVVTVPINESFETREICAANVVSFYEITPTQVYHLHPELVDQDGEVRSTKLCPACYKSIMKDQVPKLSIAAGIDFGVCQRIPVLAIPNAAEKTIIARMRLFEEVVKIRSNYSGTVTYTHYKIQGHSVLFAHDAPERFFEAAANLIMEDKLLSSLSILLVGPDGEMDWLARNTFTSATLLGRPFVIIQKLLFTNKLNRYYDDIPKKLYDRTKWGEIGAIIEKANRAILATAERVTEKEDVVFENSLGADVAATSRVSAADSDVRLDVDPSREQTEIPLRYSLVTNREIASTFEECRRQQLEALSGTFLAVGADDEVADEPEIGQSE